MSTAEVRSTPDLSVVVPVCDEEGCLEELSRRLRSVLSELDLDFEVVMVNDGSRDASLDTMRKLRAKDERFKILDLSRNFGHQVAVSAGLEHASGRAVVVMDADLQDPPEVLRDLVARWREGYAVVYAVRRRRKETGLRRLTYFLFYRILRRISDIDLPLDSGDFSLMDREVVDHLVRLPERNRYVRGLRAWVGFQQIGVEYERDERRTGHTKYDYRKLLQLAYDGIFAFSDAPLRIARNMGLAITAGAALVGGWTLFKRLVYYEVVPGFATLALLILFFGGVQLVTVGVLGEYVARIYTEVKARPLYLVRSREGLSAPGDPSASADASPGPGDDGVGAPR